MAFAGFSVMFTMPISNGSGQAIWQSKVFPDLQGRVFAMRRMITWPTMPFGVSDRWSLADRIFRPLLMESGALANSVGAVIGVGPGRGAGFMFILIGFMCILVSMAGYLNPRVQNVEPDLPDAMPAQEMTPVWESESGFERIIEATLSQGD